MPTRRESRLYWLKWIDRQYAKADPSHIKMRTELSAKEGEEGTQTIDPSDAGDPREKRRKELPPYNNGSERR